MPAQKPYPQAGDHAALPQPALNSGCCPKVRRHTPPGPPSARAAQSLPRGAVPRTRDAPTELRQMDSRCNKPCINVHSVPGTALDTELPTVSSLRPLSTTLCPHAPAGACLDGAHKSQKPSSGHEPHRDRRPCRGEGQGTGQQAPSRETARSTPGPLGPGAKMGNQRAVKLVDPLNGCLPPLPPGGEALHHEGTESNEVSLTSCLQPSLGLYPSPDRMAPEGPGTQAENCGK